MVPPLLGLATGALGYWIATFWMKPLVFYLELRSRIMADLLFYADVTYKLDDAHVQKRAPERCDKFRRHASDLHAAAIGLPCWYSWYLTVRKRRPQEVAIRLYRLSDTQDYGPAAKITSQAMKLFGYKGELTQTL